MNIKVFFKNAGELLIGELVNEASFYYEFVDLAYISVTPGQAQGQVAITFVPFDMLTLHPVPVPLKAIVADANAKLTMRVYKDQISIYDVAIKDEIIENYKSAREPSSIIVPDKKLITPDDLTGSADNKIIKLFD